MPLKPESHLGARSAMLTFVILFLINFANYLDRYLLAGAANGMALDLHFGVEGIGYLASAYLLLSTFGVIPLGTWADRSKRTHVIALCVTIWGLAAAGTGLFSLNFASLLLWRALGGIGEAGYGPASAALLNDLFHAPRNTRMLSWWSTASLFGFLLGTTLGGLLGGAGHWRVGFALTGASGLLLAWLIWRTPEPDHSRHRSQAESVRTTATPRPHPWLLPLLLLRTKSLLIIILLQGGAFFALYTSAIYLPTMLQQRDMFGLSSGQAGLLSGLLGAGAGITGTLLGGYLTEYLSQRRQGAGLFISGTAILLSIPCLLGLVSSGLVWHNLALASIFRFAMALLLNVFEGPALVAILEVVPRWNQAVALATTSLLASLLGEAFSAPLVGTLANALDPTHGLHFLQGNAGADLSLALVYTCTPVLLIAGTAAILGARQVKHDSAIARQMEQARP